MGIFDAVADLVGAREARRADPVSLEEFGYLLGASNGNAYRTKAGVSVGPKRALGISAWWRGVRYLTETIAGLPVHMYRDDVSGRSRRADPVWLSRPDVETPWYAWLEFAMMSELHKGNAYSFKMRDPLGRVVGLRPLHPDRVRPGRTSDGYKVFEVDKREDYAYTTREILHIPGLSYDGVCGLNPIQAHAETLGLITAADEYAARHFGQGSHLRAYLSLPQKLSVAEADSLKARWQQFHSGMANASEFGVIGNGAEYKTVSLDPQQTQLLETRKYNVSEIARILGVVPHKLYDLEHATYSNIEQQSIESVTDGIVPWLQRFEAWINFDPDLMPPENFIEFAVEGLLRGDTAARGEWYAKGVGGPWMTVNEARAFENARPVPGGDVLLSPLNMGARSDDAHEMSLSDMTLALQKMYLAVGTVVTTDEARQILNKFGAGLTGPGPGGAT